jgi:tetratricopeptide repeat protein 30
MSSESLSSIVYGAIRDENWADAIEVLNQQMAFHPNSRAGLSLLAFCHFQLEDFASAIQWYVSFLVSFTPLPHAFAAMRPF